MKKLIGSISLVVAYLIFAPLMTFNADIANFSSMIAQTQDQCTKQLDQAEEEYQAGKWTEAIELIEQCLKKENVGELERGRAYRILGLVYIAIQLEKEANDAVKNLLIMVPNYKVDPVKDPPSLQKIIDNMAVTLNPQITSLTPNSVDQGEIGIKLKVTGSNFVYGSVVKLNGVSKSTTYVSSTELIADVSTSDLSKTGEYDVTVYSPILSGKTSAAEKFTVQNTSSFPWTWIAVGGGAIVAAVVAILVLGGSEDDDALANPPVRP
jgi:tetratricopeptide (TPR) repeat protein